MAILKGKDKNILEHISPEELRQQNAVFLAQFPTDDAQIDYYTERAMRLWDEFEIDGSYELAGTRKNVQAWYNSKRAQMELFRKHPYWCEEAKAIIFESEEKRSIDFYDAKDRLHSIRVYIHCKTHDIPAGSKVLEAIVETLHYLDDEPSNVKPTMTARFVEVLKYKLGGTPLTKNISRMISAGTKITRFVRKCCEEFQMMDGSIVDTTKFEDEHEEGDRNFDSFEKRYAKFADAISPTATKNITLMSLNFLDFMTMSHGNSWSSCHYINSHGLFHSGDGSYSGAYKQGCFSYALDAPSFIFYTLPANTEGTEYYRCKKLIRMCCQYEDGVLITGKCYPSNEKSLIELYRSMMHKVITDIEEARNEWSCSDDVYKIADFVATAHNAAHYTDYLVDRQHPTISICTHKHRTDAARRMTIGHTAFCLHCGREISSRSSTGWLQCTDHRIRMVCKVCGKKLVDGDCHVQIGNKYYCVDCVFYCSVHERWETTDDLYGTIPMRDGEKQVCNDGMERLAQCVDCGVYHFKDKMMQTVNGCACKKHVRKYKKCALCGRYVLNKEAHADDNGNFFCGECHEIITGARGISVVKKDMYEVGDYVLMSDDVSNCVFGLSEEMVEHYPGRIVKITQKEFSGYRSAMAYRCLKLDSVYWNDWAWDENCFVGVVIGANDGLIGKKLSEITK